jgi:hypothetical protein
MLTCVHMTKFNHIRLNQETKDHLDNLKAPGQSYDGLIRELLSLVDSMVPMSPIKGPPLPKKLGVRWRRVQPEKGKKR